MENINIVLASDKNYLPYLEVTLKSLLAHHKNISVFILSTGDISKDWLLHKTPFFAKRNSKLFLANLDIKAIDKFKGNGYISKATYLRYYIEDLFEYSDSPYWVYLDCDILINGNITTPFIENPPCSLMAVSDPYIMNQLPNHRFIYEDYFNAGVLYINSNYWNRNKQKLIYFTEKLQQELMFGDQDILNFLFRNNWIKLNIEYNFQNNNLILLDNPTTPKIIHFTGPIKPLADHQFSYAKDSVSLFRAYNNIHWDDIVNLPVGFFTLTLGQNETDRFKNFR